MSVFSYMLAGCACLALLLVILAITAYSIPLGGYTWKIFARLEENSWSISNEEVWTLNSSFVEYDALKSFEFWLVAVGIVVGIVVLACVLCAIFGCFMENLLCMPCTCLKRWMCGKRKRRRNVGYVDDDDDDDDGL